MALGKLCKFKFSGNHQPTFFTLHKESASGNPSADVELIRLYEDRINHWLLEKEVDDKIVDILNKMELSCDGCTLVGGLKQYTNLASDCDIKELEDNVVSRNELEKTKGELCCDWLAFTFETPVPKKERYIVCLGFSKCPYEVSVWSVEEDGYELDRSYALILGTRGDELVCKHKRNPQGAPKALAPQ